MTPGAMARLITAINENRSLGLSAVSEKEYYAKQTSSGALLEEAGIFIALIMAVGSSLSVPRTALRDQGVFLVADGKAVYRKVRVETASRNTVLVAEGLQEGDQVIVNPPADLKDGQAVKLEGKDSQ
jgi:multidrug efflux pump subunit AcrA (membrane-fusion protein)